MDLKKKVIGFIRKEGLVKPGDQLLLGVSGGADSVFLAYILHAVRHDLSVSLLMAHYNHRLRKSSDQDEDFVKNLALELNIPFYRAQSLKDYSGAKISEDQARKWRYGFFKKIYVKYKINGLVLGHHRNDLAETVLMRMVRGTGLSGLRAMSPKSSLFSMNIIRPCLDIKREDIEAYLKSKAIRYCHDETNLNIDYLRNRIRLRLLPELEKNYNSRIIEALSDLGATASDDYDFLNNALEERIKENLVKFKGTVKIRLNFLENEHPALRRMIFRYCYGMLNGGLISLSFAHIQEAENLVFLKPVSSVVHWPNKMRLVKLKGFIQLRND